jgi:hypothetical protein
MTGVQYLKRLVNDPEVSDVRRDRAAGILASIEFRSGQTVGKKAQAQIAAKWSGYGSDWWQLLHSDEERAALEAELARDPELKARVVADAVQVKEREQARFGKPVQAAPPRGDAFWDKHLHDQEPKPTDPPKRGWADWGSDLDFKPSPFAVPGERNPPPDTDE